MQSYCVKERRQTECVAGTEVFVTNDQEWKVDDEV